MAVDLGQVVERVGLEILALEPARDLQRLLGHALLRVEVADPPGDARAHLERREAPVRRARPRALRRSAPSPSAGSPRAAVRPRRARSATSPRSRCRPPSAPRRAPGASRPRPPAGRSGATPRAPRGSGARASARARPSAGAACGGAVRLAGERAPAGLLERGRSLAARARRARRRPARRAAAPRGRGGRRGSRAAPRPRARASHSANRRCSFGALGLRQPGVRHLADQHVLEAERLLADDRRARLREDEVAQQQVVAGARRPPGRVRRSAIAPCQKIRPITEARCSSAFSAVGSWSMRAAISAWSVSGIRDGRYPSPRSASIRIVSSTNSGLPSVFSRAARAAPPAVSFVSAESRSISSLRLTLAQRLELDRGRAHAASAPRRADVQQLGPREADEQQRRLAHPGREVLDQLEQRLLAPSGCPRRRGRAAGRLRAGRPTPGPPRRSPARCARSRPPRARRRRARAGRRPPRPRRTCAASPSPP